MSVGTVLSIAMAVIIVGLIFAILYLMSQLQKSQESYIENPYCVLKTCENDPNPMPEMLPAHADKQRQFYSTINWCVTNSPTLEMEQRIQTCSADLSPADLEAYAVYYADTYMPSCGYAWKTATDIPNTGAPINANNTQQDLNSARDPFALAISNCASIKGMNNVVQYPGINSINARLV